MADRYGLVALLPMKANSERVTFKNFRSFAGKPLFRWVLDTLLSFELVDRVVINTDARALLVDHGLHDGDVDGRVIVRDRKPEICGDFVSMNLVLEDDIRAIESDVYLMTHTTNPLLTAETLRAAYTKYRDAKSTGGADSLFTVNRVQTRFYRADGSAVNHEPSVLIRTQDLEPWFEENSNLYIFSRDSFARTNARIGNHPVMYEMPAVESIDIDTIQQWELAEAMALYKRRAEN